MPVSRLGGGHAAPRASSSSDSRTKTSAAPGFLAKQLGHSLQMFCGTYSKWISSEGDRDQLNVAVGKKRGENVATTAAETLTA